MLAACLRYIEKAPRDFVTFEYVMLDRVNDAPEHARELVELVRDVPCKFNLIPFNPFPNTEFRTSSRNRIVAFQQHPARCGVRRDDPQDARRRHRCGLRPARRATCRIGRSVAPSKFNPLRRSLIMLIRALPMLLLAAAYLAGCTSAEKKPEAQQQEQRPTQPRTTLAQPQPTPPAERARLHTDLAAGYYERGQMDIAIDELNVAIKLDPDYAPAYNIFGLVYAVLGEDRKAEQSFARALGLAPNDSDIHHNWGWYLCQHKREREALEQFDIAVRNPLYRSPEIALVNAGRCAITIGDMRVAEALFPAGAGRKTRQCARRVWARAHRLQGRPLRRCAQLDEGRDADLQPAAGSALSGHVRRA